MPYRIEKAKTGRASCKSSFCKDAKTKIKAGELRLGVWVDSGNFQSWSWRHWACVTPKVIANLKESTDDLPDGLDGYDELDPEDQKIVNTAIEEGHVDDSIYKGDPETNRPGAPTRRSKKDEKDEKSPLKSADEAPKTTPKKRKKKVQEAKEGSSSPAPEKAQHSTTRPKRSTKSKGAPAENLKKAGKEDESEGVKEHTGKRHKSEAPKNEGMTTRSKRSQS